ncbi:MAG: UDP-N-acetylmuramyl-tripeptide synthetase [Labilithrix sp.]|nr:UDP-N-acetylmuramyl-tripeptide synthetase [Labilithrix sp.]MCW5817743.1 UDP-N-acetylmuramyl-tripeptide synthetase [Labilithrix sp.]
MWPLHASAVAEACGVETSAELEIHGVTAGEREPRGDELFVSLKEDDWDGHADVDRALAAGVPLALVSDRARGDSTLLVPDTRVAVRALAARFRRGFTFPVVAVGGSNGKTTTKDLVAAALTGGGRRVTKTSETQNGWTGIPFTLLDRAHRRAAPPDALVVEVGIDAPGAMADHARVVDPDLALLTMIGPEHLAGLGDLEGVAREELSLLEGTTRGPRVLNMQDARIAEWAGARPDDVRVGPGGDLAWRDVSTSPLVTAIEATWRGGWTRRFAVPLAGAHNAANLALAVAAAAALGRSGEEIAAGLAGFVAPEMRCQVHRLANDCVLIDDAYNASPPSMAAALALLRAPAWAERPLVVVLGDMLDLGAASGEHHRALIAPLAALVAERGARVYFAGEAMQALLPEVTGARMLPAELDLDVAGSVTLVKGSRGMKLEGVVATLRERAEETTPEDLVPFHEAFRTVCVTGTNGKTTTTSLVAAIVAAAREPSCRVTTIGAFVDREQVETEASGAAFVRTLLRAREAGVRTLAVETSSQSLERGFTKTWPVHAGVFTNLSRDHLDYHRTPERYLGAKAQLFMDLPPGGAAVLNLADPSSALLDEVTPPSVRRFGYAARPIDEECKHLPAALVAEDVTIDVHGTHARLAPSPIADGLGGRLDLGLVGHVHMENALGAALAAHALGYSLPVIKEALERFEGVPGRFQIVRREPIVVVDYAHTPDALERTLATARLLTKGRVIVVFGCGGDRDPGKRAEMGAAATAFADVVYVTNDNPRSEDPDAIADAIERGATRSVHRILDRAAAIATSIADAAATDIVVIAGKGHEKTQTIGDVESPFDDVEIARSISR